VGKVRNHRGGRGKIRGGEQKGIIPFSGKKPRQSRTCPSQSLARKISRIDDSGGRKNTNNEKRKGGGSNDIGSKKGETEEGQFFT